MNPRRRRSPSGSALRRFIDSKTPRTLEGVRGGAVSGPNAGCRDCGFDRVTGTPHVINGDAQRAKRLENLRRQAGNRRRLMTGQRVERDAENIGQPPQRAVRQVAGPAIREVVERVTVSVPDPSPQFGEGQFMLGGESADICAESLGVRVASGRCCAGAWCSGRGILRHDYGHELAAPTASRSEWHMGISLRRGRQHPSRARSVRAAGGQTPRLRRGLKYGAEMLRLKCLPIVYCYDFLNYQ